MFDELRSAAVVLRVSDVERSLHWWREHLDLTPAFVGKDKGGLALPVFVVGGVRVALLQCPGDMRGEGDDSGTTYLALHLDRGLEDVRAELKQRHVDVEQICSSGDFRFFWFYDPDRNKFEVASRFRPDVSI